MKTERDCGHCKHFQIDGMFGMWCDINDTDYLLDGECKNYERDVKIMTENGFRKYRKIPVVIEAAQTDKELEVKTLSGTVKANKGDWIIRGVKGEVYPCKPDIFDMTYEPVDNDDIEITDKEVDKSPDDELYRRTVIQLLVMIARQRSGHTVEQLVFLDKLEDKLEW